MVYFGIYIRRLLPNTNEFKDISIHNTTLSNPIKTLFKSYLIEFIILFFGYLPVYSLYWTCNVWIPAYLQSSLSNDYDNYAYDIQLISASLGIICCIISDIIGDKLFISYYKWFKYAMIFSMINTLICFSILGISNNIILLSIIYIQVLVSLSGLGQVSIVIWCATWIPDPRIRNTLTGVSYNLGIDIYIV